MVWFGKWGPSEKVAITSERQLPSMFFPANFGRLQALDFVKWALGF